MRTACLMELHSLRSWLKTMYVWLMCSLLCFGKKTDRPLLQAVRAWEMYNGKKIDQSWLQPFNRLDSVSDHLTFPCFLPETPLDLLLLYSSPPTVAQPSTAALPNNNRQPPNPASLFNLKPFPAKQLKAPKAVPLTGRLGPAVIPLEQRLGPVVGGPVSAPGTLSSSIGKIANKKKVNKKRGSRKSQGGMDGIEVL